MAEEGELHDGPDEEEEGGGDDEMAGSREEVVPASSSLEADIEEEDGEGEEGADVEGLERAAGVLACVAEVWKGMFGRAGLVLASIVVAGGVMARRVLAAAILACLLLCGEWSDPRTETPRFLLGADIDVCCVS